MIKKIYSVFHRSISKPQERGEYSGGYWQDKIRQHALHFCRDIKGRVLEIGCGEGLFLRQLASEDSSLEIWGVDNDIERLKRAKDYFDDKKMRNVKLLYQQAPNLIFDYEYFDAVVCVNVFLNMDSFDSVNRTLLRMKHLCKTSGKLIFDFRNCLNPLLLLKFSLARYYDATAKNLHLNAYNPWLIETTLENLDIRICDKKFIGFPIKWLAPIIIIEAKKLC